jgi:hypothetical protein
MLRCVDLGVNVNRRDLGNRGVREAPADQDITHAQPHMAAGVPSRHLVPRNANK